MSEYLGDVTAKIVVQAEGKNYKIDPVTVLLVARVVVNLVKALKACNKHTGSAVKTTKNITRRERNIIKRELKKEFGFWGYWKNGRKYVDSIVKTSSECNEEDIVKLYSEI
jgi:hypothetical protein